MSRATTTYTVHVVRDRAELARLAARMGNCLATYGPHRLGGRDRIVEIREAGETRFALHLRDGRIEMFEAPRNQRPPAAAVPVVRDLLEGAGLLRPLPPAPPVPPPPAVEPARPRARPRVTPRPAPSRAPVSPPAPLSVQELATDLLRAPAPGRTEWPELAAALWAVGLLPRLPDPEQTAYERVILDLAERIAVGDDARLPRVPVPSPVARDTARRRLVEGPPPRTSEGWQRHRMADVLALTLRA